MRCNDYFVTMSTKLVTMSMMEVGHLWGQLCEHLYVKMALYPFIRHIRIDKLLLSW